MALEYATTLRASSDLTPKEQVDCIADAVGRWARVPDPVSDADRLGRRDARVITRVLGDLTADQWAWTLQLSHPDDRDAAVEWVVSIAAVLGEAVDVTVRLERRRTDGTVLRHRERSAPPACIRALLDLDDIEFVDAGHRLTTSVWLVEPEDASALAQTILDPERRLPVFGFTPRDEDPIDGGELLPSVAGLAHVALIRPKTSWALDELLPRGLNVYGGAARLWWPGVTARSSRWDHELWAGDKSAQFLQRQAIDLIVEAGLAAATSVDPRLLELERQGMDAEARRLAERVEELRLRYEQALAQASDS
ncbi:MAG: hypothetical protein KDB35_22505, partial [Acidimicrobiales bacterium]|nr:hypothetical protein [Acidimicrobiales bacterium]